MKKIISLLLAVMLTLLCTAAFASENLVEIDYTTLALDIGELTVCDLTEDDVEADIVLALMNEDQTMGCLVYVYDGEGMTLADLEAGLAEDETVSESQMGNINGIDLLMAVGKDEDGAPFAVAFVIDEEMIVEFGFVFADESYAALAGNLIATLVRQ